MNAIKTNPGGGPTILIIEDDTLLSQMYKSKFELEGFNVLTAVNGENGLRLAVEQSVDVIILDMMLPRLPGINLLESLRQSEKGKSVPVIALTNLADEKLREQALKLGVSEFLVKAEQSPEEVVEVVKKHLPKQ